MKYISFELEKQKHFVAFSDSYFHNKINSAMAMLIKELSDGKYEGRDDGYKLLGAGSVCLTKKGFKPFSNSFSLKIGPNLEHSCGDDYDFMQDVCAQDMAFILMSAHGSFITTKHFISAIESYGKHIPYIHGVIKARATDRLLEDISDIIPIYTPIGERRVDANFNQSEARFIMNCYNCEMGY